MKSSIRKQRLKNRYCVNCGRPIDINRGIMAKYCRECSKVSSGGVSSSSRAKRLEEVRLRVQNVKM